jgi:hypothetical protein
MAQTQFNEGMEDLRQIFRMSQIEFPSLVRVSQEAHPGRRLVIFFQEDHLDKVPGNLLGEEEEECRNQTRDMVIDSADYSLVGHLLNP